MRKLALLLAAGTLVAWSAIMTVAQEGPATREAPRREAERPKLGGELGRMVEVCGLNEEQQKKLSELSQAREKAIQEINVKFQADVQGVLTPEQRAKWNEATMLQMVQRMFARANLTEEQTGKVKAAIAEQTKGLVLSDEKARAEAGRKLFEFINKEILTDEQRTLMRPPERREGERREGERRDAPPAPKTEGERK